VQLATGDATPSLLLSFLLFSPQHTVSKFLKQKEEQEEDVFEAPLVRRAAKKKPKADGAVPKFSFQPRVRDE
jgi:hypothetical protein